MKGKKTLPTLIAVLTCYATLLTVTPFAAPAESPLFGNSYAIVIGIDNYSHIERWKKLDYAVKDAEGVSDLLTKQGFEVISLYNKEATARNIQRIIVDNIAPKLTGRDRVVLFFAGHGRTQVLPNKEHGHLVPHDADDTFASMIPMSWIFDWSDRMSIARHQLFIFDACFGGMIAMRGSKAEDPSRPNYIQDITSRYARQVLTAGGADQPVADIGPDGHSIFTGQFIKAVEDGLADTNNDGFITFSELSSFLQARAAHSSPQWSQTPGAYELPGHLQGDFVLVNPKYIPRPKIDVGFGGTAVYEMLNAGKKFFVEGNYLAAMGKFLEAARLGNVEAMTFVGNLYWRMQPRDYEKSLFWYKEAAGLGDWRAMQSLGAIYEFSENPQRNLVESERWKLAALRAQQIADATVIHGGEPRPGDLITPSAVIVPPTAPSNLTVR